MAAILTCMRCYGRAQRPGTREGDHGVASASTSTCKATAGGLCRSSLITLSTWLLYGASQHDKHLTHQMAGGTVFLRQARLA